MIAPILVLLASSADPVRADRKGASPGPRTPEETTGRPTPPAEARRFLRSLASLPGWDYRELPISGGPDAPPLPVALWPAPGGREDPSLTVLLMAGQHGDEPSGSDALLRLIRDLAGGLRPEWRGRLQLIILPMMNPWGLDAGVRNNASNLDLNRDHLRLRAPETRALHRLFAEWLPQVTIDLHEKPEPCRHVEWGEATHPSEDARRRSVEWRIVGDAGKALAALDVPSHPYFTRSFAAAPGSDPPRMEVFYRPALPDPSDSLNSFALQGACAFFVETAQGPPDAAYAGSVDIQYLAVTALVEAALERAGEVREAVERFRASPLRPRIALQMRPSSSRAHPAGLFTPCAESADRWTGIQPWLPRLDVSLYRWRPAAYLLPARFSDAASVLNAHGVRLLPAGRAMEVRGEVGRIVGTSPPLESPAPPLAAAEFVMRSVSVRPGDWIVPVASPYWDLLPVLLEAESQFGLGRYPDLGLTPRVGEDYPVVRLPALPAERAPAHR